MPDVNADVFNYLQQHVSVYAVENCNRVLTANGAQWLCSRLMDHDPSRQLLFRSVEILWNVLEKCTDHDRLGVQLNDILCMRCSYVSLVRFRKILFKNFVE